MFENKLRVISKRMFWFGIIAGVITLISLLIMRISFGSSVSSSELPGLIVVALSLIPELACVFSSIFLYGFAIIIENTRLIKEYTYKLLEEKEK